jgi:hypothetical protein
MCCHILQVGIEEEDEALQLKGTYLTTDQHLYGTVDWLAKDPEACDWLCGWWTSNEFRVMFVQNRHNWLSKESVHCYGANRHVHKTHRVVRKTHNFNSQLLRN